MSGITEKEKAKLTATQGRNCGGGGVCKVKKDLTGQVVIVTGSNTGIGRETARVLAQYGATVILACRDQQKTEKVVQELKEITGSQLIEFIRLDLSDLKSIKDFVTEFKQKHNKLNVLINNAGVMMIQERTLTKDGFEMQFGTNHLGHFYLTNLLLDTLKVSAPSRVITLSSGFQQWGKIKWDNLQSEKKYTPTGAYGQSKLANVLFSNELQRRLEGTNVYSYSVDPGAINTDLQRHVKANWFWRNVLLPGMKVLGKSPIEGAQPSLYCALEDLDKLKAGALYKDCKKITENKFARKEENCRKLWEVSEKMIAEKLAN